MRITFKQLEMIEDALYCYRPEHPQEKLRSKTVFELYKLFRQEVAKMRKMTKNDTNRKTNNNRPDPDSRVC